MCHPFPPNLGLDDLHTTFLTYDASMLHTLILATVALIIFCGTKNFGTKKAVSFRLKGSIVDGLRLLNLSMGPF
jgi:hypothetical protein